MISVCARARHSPPRTYTLLWPATGRHQQREHNEPLVGHLTPTWCPSIHTPQQSLACAIVCASAESESVRH